MLAGSQYNTVLQYVWVCQSLRPQDCGNDDSLSRSRSRYEFYVNHLTHHQGLTLRRKTGKCIGNWQCQSTIASESRAMILPEDTKSTAFVFMEVIPVVVTQQTAHAEFFSLDPEPSGLRHCFKCHHPAICTGYKNRRVLRR